MTLDSITELEENVTMTATKIYFTGFNGYGQFTNLSKVTSFEEIKLQSNTQIIRSLWNYCVYTNDNILNFSGCINGESNQIRQLSFEHQIKDVACAECFCLVLLDTGIAYKINCQTFEIAEINSTIIQRFTREDKAKSVQRFSNFSANHENELNFRLDEYITHIAAGRSLSIVVTNKNHIYNLPLKIFTFPTHVKIKKISCGNEHCLILTSNGDLYTFGNSSRGQLGLGSLESEDVPILIEALAGIKIIDMAAGGWHSVAISAFNDFYGWGWNVNGQIGQPLYKNYTETLKNGSTRVERQKCSTVFASPIIIDLPIDETTSSSDDDVHIDNENQYHAIGVSAGARHTIVKVEENLLLGAGWNKYSQLASNIEEHIDQFRVIKKNISADVRIICGEWSTFAILSR